MEENHDFSQMSSDEIWEVLPNLTGRDRGYALMSLAHFAWSNHEVDQLLPLAMEAKDLFTEIGDTRELGLAYDLIGSAHANGKNLPEAIAAYRKAIANLSAYSADSEVAMVHQHAAHAFNDSGELDEAITNFEIAISHYVAIGEYHQVRHCFDYLGDIYTLRGQYKEALEIFQREAEHLAESGDVLMMLEAEIGLSRAYDKLGDGENALVHAKIAESLGKACGCKTCPVRTSWQIAASYETLGKKEKAIKQCDKLHALAVKNGQRVYVARAMSLKGRLIYLDKPKEAKKLLTDASAIFKSANRPLLGARADEILAHIAFHQGKYLKAEQIFKTIIALFESEDWYVAAAETNCALAEVYLIMGQPEKALAELNRENMGIENIPGMLQTLDHLGVRMRAELALGHTEEAINLATEVIETADAEQFPAAFGVAHEVRARANATLDPHSSARDASLSLAYYVAAEATKDAERIANELFIKPVEQMKVIAEDNMLRAETQAVEDELFSVFPKGEPSFESLIAQEVESVSPESSDESETA